MAACLAAWMLRMKQGTSSSSSSSKKSRNEQCIRRCAKNSLAFTVLGPLWPSYISHGSQLKSRSCNLSISILTKWAARHFTLLSGINKSRRFSAYLLTAGSQDVLFTWSEQQASPALLLAQACGMFLKPTSGLHDKGGGIALSVTIMADGTMMRSLID